MGRQKQFTEPQVLEQAMQVFWSQGYENTSVQDLVDATSINRASLYSTFGDKEQLYLSCLTHYISIQTEKRRQLLQSPEPAHEAISKYLHSLVDFALGEGRKKGCLVTNSSVEVAPLNDKVHHHLEQTVQGVEDLLEQLVRRGQIEGDITSQIDSRKLAQFLICQVQGLRVLTRAYPEDVARMRAAVEVALSALN
ncbi:TetR/AcrR family transcriptional regulator [Rhodovibrionaceae bacterium A322]